MRPSFLKSAFFLGHVFRRIFVTFPWGMLLLLVFHIIFLFKKMLVIAIRVVCAIVNHSVPASEKGLIHQ